MVIYTFHTDKQNSVYSLFSALIMHVYQMRSSNQSIVNATQQRLTTCMNALKEVSKVWLVAKMVATLFESILGNKVLEERLQKAAGRRHHNRNKNLKGRKELASGDTADAQKRKFDDMEFGYTNGQPAPQVSYERSRPQSPALTEPRDGLQHNQTQRQSPMAHIAANSPPTRQTHDAFMGTSRTNTRPNTPFNNFPYPGTPPDLILHTRNSPKISEDLWQNYQPDQLFPPEANRLLPLNAQSPNQQMVDPALRVAASSQQQFATQQQSSLQTPAQLPGRPLPIHEGSQTMAPLSSYHHDPNTWSHIQALQAQLQSDDAWSNSSSTGVPTVPTALNVGDWFEFFGIPSGTDISGLDGVTNYT